MIEATTQTDKYTENTLTELELIAKLLDVKGAKAIGLLVETDARLLKTGNLYGNVTKVSRVNVQVNFHYDAGVLRRLAAEGKSEEDFRKGESWHVPVIAEDGKLTPFCSHPKTGEFYLRVQVLGYGETRYFTEEGKEVTREEIEPWLPKSKGKYANQGLDTPLEFKVYKLSGLMEVALDGVRYTIVNGI